MADLFQLAASGNPGDKLARNLWGGARWVVLPLDQSTTRTWMQTKLKTDSGEEPWLDINMDASQQDWEVLP
jgi:hypothetical protein